VKFFPDEAVPEKEQNRKRRAMMYTGSLIEDLMTTVERAERHAQPGADVAQVEHWHVLPLHQLPPVEQNLLGVA
jgi:Uri superfamily endonuclease